MPPAPSLHVLHWGTDIFRQNALFCTDCTSTVLVRPGGGRACEQPHLDLGALRAAGQTKAHQSDRDPCPLLTDEGSSSPPPYPLGPHLSVPWTQVTAKLNYLLLSCFPAPHFLQVVQSSAALCSQLSNMNLCLMWARPVLDTGDTEVTNEGPQGGNIMVWERDHRPIRQHQDICGDSWEP